MTAEADWQEQNEHVHAAVASAVRNVRGDMVLNMVVVAVVADSEGEKTIACWTSPDQRQWETLGLLEHVRLDHGAWLAEQRINREDG